MLPRHDEPIVAVATAAGRGAVGIVRLSGRGLAALHEPLLGLRLRPRHAHYGPFLAADGSALDHGIALWFPAPHSYTGEDVLELQAHGGPVLLQLLLQRCLQAAAELDAASGQPRLPGLRLARPGEFTERAFLNGKLDLAQAEAVADLIDASTEAAARSAVRSLSGAFSQAVQALLEELVQLRTLVEATLDFPEEDIDVLRQADAGARLQQLQQRVAEVLARTRQGALLREGMHVVIAGQPNAGKSSLLNALAQAEVAIVTPMAGTTRDVVQQAIQIEGVPLHIVDTAGLREGGEVDEVERIGIERAWQRIAQADAVLFVHDLTRASDPGYATADAAIRARLPAHVPIIDVWNKADAVGASCGDDGTGGVCLSARSGAGLPALRRRLLEQVGWQAGNAEGLYSARQRHVEALQRVQAHLQAAGKHLDTAAPALELLAEELRLAQEALATITGVFGADDLLGVIFSRFCIGK